jgi:hypothetical protein
MWLEEWWLAILVMAGWVVSIKDKKTKWFARALFILWVIVLGQQA